MIQFTLQYKGYSEGGAMQNYMFIIAGCMLGSVLGFAANRGFELIAYMLS